MEYTDELCDAYNVEQTAQGFCSTMRALSLLYKHIVGKRGHKEENRVGDFYQHS